MKCLVIIVAMATMVQSLPQPRLNLTDTSISLQDGIQTVTDKSLKETSDEDIKLASRSLFASPINQHDQLYYDYDSIFDNFEQTDEKNLNDLAEENITTKRSGEHTETSATITALPLPPNRNDSPADTIIFKEPMLNNAGIDPKNVTDEEIFKMLGEGDNATESTTKAQVLPQKRNNLSANTIISKDPMPNNAGIDRTYEELFKMFSELESATQSTTAQPLLQKQICSPADTIIFKEPMLNNAGIDDPKNLTDEEIFKMLGEGDNATESTTKAQVLPQKRNNLSANTIISKDPMPNNAGIDLADEKLLTFFGELESATKSTTAQPLLRKQIYSPADTIIFKEPMLNNAGIDDPKNLTDVEIFKMLGEGDNATESTTKAQVLPQKRNNLSANTIISKDPMPNNAGIDLADEELLTFFGELESATKFTTAQPLLRKQIYSPADTIIFKEPMLNNAGIDDPKNLTDEEIFKMLGEGDNATESTTKAQVLPQKRNNLSADTIISKDPMPNNAGIDLADEELLKMFSELESATQSTTAQPLLRKQIYSPADTIIFKEPMLNKADIDDPKNLTDEEILKILGEVDNATESNDHKTSFVLKETPNVPDMQKSSGFEDIGDDYFDDDFFNETIHDNVEKKTDTTTSTSTTPAGITEAQTEYSDTETTEYPPDENFTADYDIPLGEDTNSDNVVIPIIPVISGRSNTENSPCNYQPWDQPIEIQRMDKRVSEIQCEYNMWQYKYHVLEKERKNKECFKLIKNERVQIIGGKKAEDGEFPHMGAVGWRKIEGGYKFMCGSSLISNNFAITAAHCYAITEILRIEKELVSKYPDVVRFGTVKIQDLKLKNSLNDVDISSIIKLPKYKSKFRYNDVALIKLARDVPTEAHVRPACLWNGYLNGHSEGNVTGWGQTNMSTSSVSDYLLYATIDFIHQSTCETLLEDYTNKKAFSGLMEHQMCAGKLSGSADTCQGDSGGPIQIQQGMPSNIDEAGTIHHVVGITSFGIGCARKNMPGVYVNISDPNIMCWIEKNVWPDEPNTFCPEEMFQGYNPLILT